MGLNVGFVGKFVAEGKDDSFFAQAGGAFLGHIFEGLGDVVMNADRQVVFAGESADARQCGMVGAGTFAGGEVCEVVVPGDHLADGPPNAGKFLDSFDEQVDGAEVGCVKTAKGGVNSAQLGEFDAGRAVQIIAGTHKRLVLRPFFEKGHTGNKGVFLFGVVHAFEP